VTAAVVRPAAVDDVDAMTRVFLACWHDSYAGLLPPDIRDLYTADSAGEMWRRVPLHHVLVAEVSGRGVLGMVRFGADPDDSRRGHVFSLYVHPDSQGLGLGRALLTAATEALVARGHTQATLWVFTDNAAARGFYTRLGWLPDGTTRTEAAYRLPEIRLHRRLGALT
jgi:ribosomal protein S18 acetylase RimI-like enzyme